MNYPILAAYSPSALFGAVIGIVLLFSLVLVLLRFRRCPQIKLWLYTVGTMTHSTPGTLHITVALYHIPVLSGLRIP